MVVLTVDRNIYSDECISKAVYSLLGKYVVNRITNGNTEHLEIKVFDGSDEENVEQEFLSALNDYKLRQIIEQETHDIRTILYAKAFSEFDESDFDDV